LPKFNFFYRYIIYHKNFGIRQFSSSIMKSKFGSGSQNSSQNPWANSKFLYPYSKLQWVTGFDFWHGPKNKTLGYVKINEEVTGQRLFETLQKIFFTLYGKPSFSVP
jgi:hypothetical protein